MKSVLPRRVGRLKSLVVELTGKSHFRRFDSVYDIWSSGLSHYRETDIPDIALGYCIDAVGEAIGKLEADIARGVRDARGNLLQEAQGSIGEPLRAFVAHKGETTSLDKLRTFLDAIGIECLIAESEPSDGRSVEGQVTWTYEQADFAIILATKAGVKDDKKGTQYMGLNVADELGRARVTFRNRIILLLQQGVEPHTNINEIVHERFSPGSMDKAFTKILRELKNWGMIKLVKQQSKE